MAVYRPMPCSAGPEEGNVLFSVGPGRRIEYNLQSAAAMIRHAQHILETQLGDRSNVELGGERFKEGQPKGDSRAEPEEVRCRGWPEK